MTDHVFRDKYDFNEEGNGSAIVPDDKKQLHEVDFETFCALIVLFYTVSINMKISNKQYLGWSDFIVDEEIRQILNLL